MTTQSNDGTVATLQPEVQRLLGRCLLRLQQYEHLIKVIMAHQEIAGPAHELESIRSVQVANNAGKTLGNLVGRLLGSYLATDDIDTDIEVQVKAPADVIAFGMRMQLILSPEDYARTQTDLKELVLLRNNLVHHFIAQHDLWDLAGCRAAHSALLDAYNCIDRHFEQLRAWAEHMDQTRQVTAEFLQSDVVIDWISNGIAPDGVVDWPSAGIVRALKAAAAELAVGGWTPVALAERWIAERFPEQLPIKYGCKNWPEVVRKSVLYELEYREVGGQRAAGYRRRSGRRAAQSPVPRKAPHLTQKK